MADITDKLIKQSNGTQPLPTTLSAQKNSGATTASLNAATGWDTTTAKHIRMYKTKVVNGQTVPDWDNVCFYKGTLSGTTLSNLTLAWSSTGSDQTFGIGDTVDLSYTAGWGEDLVEGLLVEHNQDGTHGAVTATSVTASGTITAANFVQSGGADSAGWTVGLPAVSSVTANGNRSYTVEMASDVSDTLSEGMRLRTTRTAAAPNTAFSLDGSNDYYVKTSPSGMTFTDDFSVSAWVYLTSYSATSVIASRYNGTSGWSLQVIADGRLRLSGYNSGGANYSQVTSYQSVPLNKWVHVAAQLDMSAYPTVDATKSYVMIDGVNVPAEATRGGTNPTSLIQAGNLEIGSVNGGTLPFAGYLDQVAIYSAKVTQATHLAAMHQGLTGSETSLISAYANGSTTDLSATGNNLTAQNGATTVASSPFGNRGVSTTLDYGLVMKVATTTVTVQVPEGCTIPTSGGVSAVAYSTQANPYGWVSDKGRWILTDIDKRSQTYTTTAWGAVTGYSLYAPVGSWIASRKLTLTTNTDSAYYTISQTLPTGGADGPLAARLHLASGGYITDYSEGYLRIDSAGAISLYALMGSAGTLTIRGDTGQNNITLTPSSL